MESLVVSLGGDGRSVIIFLDRFIHRCRTGFNGCALEPEQLTCMNKQT